MVSHHFLIIFSALDLRSKTVSGRGDVPALQLPRLDLSISAAQLGFGIWKDPMMSMIFQDFGCVFKAMWMTMLMDDFGCFWVLLWTHPVKCLRLFFFFTWFASVCLNFISGQLVGLKKWRFPKSCGYPKSSKSLDHDFTVGFPQSKAPNGCEPSQKLAPPKKNRRNHVFRLLVVGFNWILQAEFPFWFWLLQASQDLTPVRAAIFRWCQPWEVGWWPSHMAISTAGESESKKVHWDVKNNIHPLVNSGELWLLVVNIVVNMVVN